MSTKLQATGSRSRFFLKKSARHRPRVPHNPLQTKSARGFKLHVRSPVVHKKSRRDSDCVSADPCDGNNLRLVIIHAPDAPAIRRACFAALVAWASVTDKYPPCIGGVVGLIQDNNAPNRKTTGAIERDLGSSLGISGRPPMSVATAGLNLRTADVSRT